MLIVSVSEAQKQFSKIINKPTLIIDQKKSSKKAVILPYDVYQELLKQSITKASLATSGFADFVGVLNKDFKTKDKKYHQVIK